VRTIWYMGAKTRLTAEILEAVHRASPRAKTVLDLMSGTAVVSQALAPRYRVVSNDVQGYATLIAEAYLVHTPTSRRIVGRLDMESDLGEHYRKNLAHLFGLLESAIAVEDAFLEAYGFEPDPNPVLGSLEPGTAARARARRKVPGDPRERAVAYRTFALAGTPAFLEERDVKATGVFKDAQSLFLRATVAKKRADPRAFPYSLASSYYPNVYLGLRQAIAVDSLRYAIDQLSGRGAVAKRTHYLAALLHAASVTTSATSHFCQPRGLVRDSEVKAVLTRRSFDIATRVKGFSDEIAQVVATTPHKPGNAARTGDWRAAFADWDAIEADVVYADPPYTADNYSRFYHALEVITRYDYPELEVFRGHTTKGRYPLRATRHQSAFCHKRGVEAELRALARETAARGAALVLSYGEENGLVFKTWRERGDSKAQALRRFEGLARDVFRDVKLIKRPLLHSGQGDSNKTVTELLLVASAPKNVAPCA
jgi:adenine-specific DNA methylase